jgi:formate dehydrogenase major subunit
MDVTRRDFLKISGAATAGLMLGSLFDLKPIQAHAQANPPEWEALTTSICCYCAVGCGLLVGSISADPYITYVQGDPDHPINQGSLCSKGQAMAQLRTVDGALNPKRLTEPLYRGAGATSWTPVSWNWAINKFALLIKNTRDGANLHYSGSDPNSPTMNTTLEDWIEDPEEIEPPGWYPANRCTGIASLGGAAHDTEECYLLVKLLRALGLVYIEHQARI